MPQAIVNPDDVRKFAQRLRQFSADLQNNSSRLHSEFRQLGETWRDQEYARFAQEFEQTARVIQRFLQTSDTYTQSLIRKAEAAQRYLDQR